MSDCKTVKQSIIDKVVSKDVDMCNIFDIYDIVKYVDNLTLIHCDDRSKICLYGKECIINLQYLFEYNNYYVIFDIDEEGDEGEVEQWNTYGGISEVLQKCITVVHKNEYDDQKYLHKIKNIDVIANYFVSMYVRERPHIPDLHKIVTNASIQALKMELFYVLSNHNDTVPGDSS